MIAYVCAGTPSRVSCLSAGYGSQAIPDVIPANSTLVFEIELLNIYKPMKPVVFEEHVHGPNCGHSH
jgi:hypothetical protein